MAAVDGRQQNLPNKIRWGELEEDDADYYTYLLPPPVVIGPDENGVKKTIEYKFNDDGVKVKVTKTTRTRKLAQARLSKKALERRDWAKFGDAVREEVGNRLTMISTEEIILERPRAPGSKGEEAAAPDALDKVVKAGAVLMVCRICQKKGDHWTAQCPYKDLAPTMDSFLEAPPTDPAAPGPSGAAPRSNAYVPPGMRAGATPVERGLPDRRRNDENSVRVTNLSEDTREPDLMELFRTFGPISRVYVAVDQKSGLSRGFGFVNFVNRADAERAINKLNGYGYDNLILHVEWATPRAN